MFSKIAELVKQGKPLTHIPFIDFHGHLGNSSLYYSLPRIRPEQIKSYLRCFGIDHFMCFSLCIDSDPTVGNMLQYKFAADDPQLFSTLTLLHAAFPQDWASIIEEGEKANTRGLKLIPAYQGVDELSIDWTAAFDQIAEKQYVVLNHSWGNSEKLAFYARTYPKIKFIVGHSSVDYVDVIDKYDNVYQCTCACSVANCFPSFEKLVNCLPKERILFGSDALDLDVGMELGPVALSDVPEETKELILGRNALRLIKELGWNVGDWVSFYDC